MKKKPVSVADILGKRAAPDRKNERSKPAASSKFGVLYSSVITPTEAETSQIASEREPFTQVTNQGDLEIRDDYTSKSFDADHSLEVKTGTEPVEATSNNETAGLFEPSAHAENGVEVTNDPTSQLNLGQTSDKLRTNGDLNLGQTSDKLRTNLGQDISTLIETSDKPRTQLRTLSRTNLGQISDKLRTISGFQSLSGLQKKLTILIYEICLSKGTRNTGPISIEHLCLQTQSPRLSIQKSIQRLEQKEILIRKEFKVGRGGWTVYELLEKAWTEILQSETSDKLRTNLGQTSDKLRTEPRTQLRTSAPSSSSSVDLNLKRTTTTEMNSQFQFVIPESLQNLGLTSQRLNPICLIMLPEQIQESIDHFAYDIEAQQVRPDLRIIFGVLRKKEIWVSSALMAEIEKQARASRERALQKEALQREIATEALQEKYHNFCQANPQFREEVRAKQKFPMSDTILDTVAFEEFKNQYGVELQD